MVTAASTLMRSFVTVDDRGQGFERVLLLVAGLLVNWFLARSRWIDLWMSHVIAAALQALY
jgi:hypothetical protein